MGEFLEIEGSTELELSDRLTANVDSPSSMIVIPSWKRGVALGLAVGFTCAASAIQVTYQVDLSVQIALGNFNPAADTVFVSGDFSNPAWRQTAADGAAAFVLSPSGGGPEIYVGTFDIVTVNPNFENHKFVINPNNGFASLRWEDVTGGGNRFFQAATTNMVLPVVFFGDQSTVPGQNPVTFKVDLGCRWRWAISARGWITWWQRATSTWSSVRAPGPWTSS